jgi:Tripartite tricarboxylate transporter TctB family
MLNERTGGNVRTIDLARRRNQAAGALICVIGVAATLQGRTYPMGTLSQMGPGFFPVVLGLLLAAIGAVLLLTAGIAGGTEAAERRTPEWRGWACIALAIIAFAVLGDYGGLLPATFASVFIAALGDRRNGVLRSFILAVFMVCVCLVVFWWALKVQLPLFQWG